MKRPSFPASRLLEFLDQEADYPKTKLIAFAIISGMANGLLLGVINHGAGMVGEFSASGEIQYQYLAIFCVILALFVYTKKYTLDRAAILVEEVLCKVRLRIADKIRHTELEFIEGTGYSNIYNCLSQDTVQISQSATVVFASIEAGIMLTFAMMYIFWLTPQGFMLTTVAILLGGWVFVMKRDVIMNDLSMATKHEVRFFEALGHTLSGFKEVKMNRAKSHDLFVHQQEIAAQVKQSKGRAGINSVFVMMFSEVFFYILIATVLFIWPMFGKTDPSIVIKLTASILFIIGPLDLLFGSLPLFVKADVAVGNLRALEQQINTASRSVQTGEPVASEPLVFSQLTLNDVYFEYQNVEGTSQFKVGPIDFSMRAGEIIFVVGGNGSGKSTLLKLLTGLYYPLRGQIEVDGEKIDRDLYPDYRELFSIIFTDFHLFDRLYGLDGTDEKKVKSLLKKMGMEHKTKFRDGAFTNINLSTGQRKRLAYVNAVMDDKQIYIFDELAADQDPEFRKNFYEVLLPELRNEGKTIVAVTHDDKYFSTADRVLRMDEGKLIEGKPN